MKGKIAAGFKGKTLLEEPPPVLAASPTLVPKWGDSPSLGHWGPLVPLNVI